MDKRSSLLGLFVSNDEKGFIMLTTRVNVIKLFSKSLTFQPLANKLEHLCLGKFSSESHICRAGQEPTLEFGRSGTLLENIRLGWKAFSRTNALAYLAS